MGRDLEHLREWKRASYKKHRKRYLAYNKKWRDAHPLTYLRSKRKSGRAFYARLKRAVHEALGNQCRKCGFTDSRALQIDHRRGGGRRERQRYYPNKLLRMVLKNPARYQLLCANCNCIKRILRRESTPRKSV